MPQIEKEEKEETLDAQLPSLSLPSGVSPVYGVPVEGEGRTYKIPPEEIQTPPLPSGMSSFSAPSIEAPPLPEGMSAIGWNQIPVPGGQSLLGKVIDLASRTEYATASLVKQYIDYYEKTGTYDPQEVLKNIDWSSFTEGIIGKDKTSYAEIVNHIIPNEHWYTKMMLSLGLSYIGDPLTYLLPVIGPAIKTAGKATKGVTHIPGVTKAIERTKQIPPIKALGKAFVPGYGSPKFRAYYEKKYQTGLDLQHAQREILNDVENISKGVSKQDAALLSYLRENINTDPNAVNLLSADFNSRLDMINHRFQKLLDNLLEEGIIKEDTHELWQATQDKYLSHIYETTRFMRAELPPSLFEKAKKAFYTKGRTHDTLAEIKKYGTAVNEVAEAKSLDDIHDIVSRHETLREDFPSFADPTIYAETKDSLALDDIKRYAKVRADHFLSAEENIYKIYGLRALDQAVLVNRRKFVKEVLDAFGYPLHDIEGLKKGSFALPEGYKAYYPTGALRFFGADVVTESRVNSLKRMYGELIPAEALDESIKSLPSMVKVRPTALPEDIAEDMNQGLKFLNPEERSFRWVKDFLTGIMTAWKFGATTMNPPFHFRNFISSTWQSLISGVHNPHRFIQSVDVLTRKGGTTALNGQVWKNSDLVSLMDRMGVINKGWFGNDLNVNMIKELDSIMSYGKWRHYAPNRIPRSFGAAIENHQRATVFLDRLSKGQTPLEAQKAVRRYHFDYEELTETEKKIRRYVYPFYTWQRKNLALQLSTLPRLGPAAGYGKLLRSMSSPETSEERALKPKEWDDMMYVKSPIKSPQGKPLYWSVDLPPTTINEVQDIKHFTDTIAQSLSPLILVTQAVLTGTKNFPNVGEKIKRLPILNYSRAPWWMAYLPDKFKKELYDKKILENINTALTRDTGLPEVGVDSTWLYTVNLLFPFLSSYGKLQRMPITVSDENPEAARRSWYTGVQQQYLDTEWQQTIAHWAVQDHMENVSTAKRKIARELTEEDIEGLMPYRLKKEVYE